MALPALSRVVSRRRTEILGALALASAGVLGAVELQHVWRRGSARSSAQQGDYVEAGRAATRETVAVIREGYHAGSARENALFNVLVSFVVTFAATRAITYLIRRGFGPFGNLVIGRRHIHHFVPGILIAFSAGGLSIGLRHENLDKWLAVPFGGGVALVFDEAALLLELEDVYWSKEGLVSVQITLGTVALLASLGLAARLMHRGEPFVLASPPAAGAE
ncbi:MAG TPA: hypothetical protein VEY49_06270 [Solirubrobacteraceae bacterium]|nr:hypothetical protein [Solirubrobacteraceae bacterium]